VTDMIEINSPKINKKLLEEKVEDIIKFSENKKAKKEGNKNKETKRNIDLTMKDVYTIEDFIKYHDIEFIRNVYDKVLSDGIDKNTLENKLNLLRSGEKSKSEILSMVRFSKEGRKKGIKIIGIKKRFIMMILNRIPIINIFVRIFMLPRFVKRSIHLKLFIS